MIRGFMKRPEAKQCRNHFSSESPLKQRVSPENAASDGTSLSSRLDGLQRKTLELMGPYLTMSIDQIDSEISGSIRNIAETLGLDRCYLAQYPLSQKGLVCTHVYETEGRKNTAISNEISVPQWVVRKIEDRQCAAFSRIEDLPADEEEARKYFRSAGTQSHAALPLESDGDLVGCMVLETTRAVITWPEAFFSILKPMADVFALSIQRKRKQREYMERMRFEVLLANLTARFVQLEADEIDAQIEHSLEKLGEFFQADRCGMLEVQTDRECCRVRHAWYSEGIEKVPKDANLALLFPWSYARLVRDRQSIYVSNLSHIPPEARQDLESYKAMGVRSSITIPLPSGKHIFHVLVLNNINTERLWPTEYVSRLLLVGEVFANALIRKQAEGELQKSYEEIRKLKDRLQDEAEFLRSEIKSCLGSKEIIGRSRALSIVMTQAAQVAPTDSTVLISGETGTGKELIARAIHDMSVHRDKVMVKVNCASLPATLVESELFGREKGAYTGALTRQIGRFEMADGSTIFLDEIAELPLELQAKLLRVLHEGEFERLGSPRTIKVHVRFIAATNRNLMEAVKAEKFRQDLFYRLNVFPIAVPPLRERIEDIPMLVWAFLNEFCDKMGKQILKIEKRDMEALQRYSWPGNVRELRNSIEHAVIISSGSTLELKLPQDGEKGIVWAKTLEEVEYRHIMEVLRHTGGRIKGDSGAARILGMIPSTLTSRMKKLGIRLHGEKEKGEISS